MAIGNTKTIELLIDKKADLKAKDNYGKTPLHWAIGRGNTKTIELLIEAGADVNAKDNDGRTPLQLAIEEGNTDSIHFRKCSVQ